MMLTLILGLTAWAASAGVAGGGTPSVTLGQSVRRYPWQLA